jgi:hypothetical protein
MHRTFNTIRLFVASTALVLAVLATTAARAWSPCGASFHWPAMAGEPAAPDHCKVSNVVPPGIGGNYALVECRDKSDNEDGFTVEWWARVNGQWVLQATQDVPANSTSAGFIYPMQKNQYRVRAFNANGVSAWSSWAKLNM